MPQKPVSRLSLKRKISTNFIETPRQGGTTSEHKKQKEPQPEEADVTFEILDVDDFLGIFKMFYQQDKSQEYCSKRNGRYSISNVNSVRRHTKWRNYFFSGEQMEDTPQSEDKDLEILAVETCEALGLGLTRDSAIVVEDNRPGHSADFPICL